MRARLLAGLLACALAMGCGEDVDHIPPHAESAERHWVEADDGYFAHLQRYPADGPAVVLCHGISSNHHFWDLTPDRSLALYLQDRGFDVWNLDLRGHGFARRDSDGKRQKPGWSVDDYGMYDLPAVLDYVQAHSASDELHYIGHSMGGMVLAVYLAHTPRPPLDSAVVVGSPLDFRDPDFSSNFMLRNAWVAKLTGFTPSPMGARLLNVWGGDKGPLHAIELLLNPDNVDEEHRRLTFKRVVSPLSRGEVKQFGAISEDGEFKSANGRLVYRENLEHVRVPMLFVAGRADRIVSPDRVYGYYEAVGSGDKDFLVVGKENGFSGDYGHLDFGVADAAADELYPHLHDWLETHP